MSLAEENAIFLNLVNTAVVFGRSEKSKHSRFGFRNQRELWLF